MFVCANKPRIKEEQKKTRTENVETIQSNADTNYFSQINITGNFLSERATEKSEMNFVFFFVFSFFC